MLPRPVQVEVQKTETQPQLEKKPMNFMKKKVAHTNKDGETTFSIETTSMDSDENPSV